MIHFANIWVCQGCNLTSSKDSYSGYHSVMVTNRHHDYNGLAQAVPLTGGHSYNLTAMIKLLNMEAGAGYQTVETIIDCLNNTGHKLNIKFGHDPFVRLNEWTLIGGIYNVPLGIHGCHMSIHVFGSSVDYLVDHASLQEVQGDPNWKTEANARIEQIRKADITVSLTGASTSHSYEVEIIQTKHEFAFGSAVGAAQIVDPNFSKYAQTFYENFEWAVLENALKWKQMEHTRGHVNYEPAMTALHALTGNGTKVRAHNVFWGVSTKLPEWLSSLSRQEILTEMDSRIKGVVSHTRGLVEHWDVNNENLHGDWYEKATGNANITAKMFHDVHAVDPKVKLFLNDYGIMENIYSLPLRHQAIWLKESGVPIYGVGIQSHLKNIHFNISSLKNRLDMVAEAGLPIWITELTLSSHDEHQKATALADILTLYFSHPAVEGVLFWGFWDGKISNPENALFNGPDIMPNEAGRAYQTLFKTTWRTHVTHTFHSNSSWSVRGFKGTYNIIVKSSGQEIKRETITLGSDGAKVTINVESSPTIIVG